MPCETLLDSISFEKINQEQGAFDKSKYLFNGKFFLHRLTKDKLAQGQLGLHNWEIMES